MHCEVSEVSEVSLKNVRRTLAKGIVRSFRSQSEKCPKKTMERYFGNFGSVLTIVFFPNIQVLSLAGDPDMVVPTFWPLLIQ